MRIVIALPVLNEEKVLESTVRALRSFVDAKLKHAVIIVIADNGSTDATRAIGEKLESSLIGVRYLRLNERGKGLAVRKAWASVEADAYVFMDADLAVDLADLPELVGCIERGAGLCVGSRYLPKSVVHRTLLRKILSRGYRAVVGSVLETRVSDIPCGFKAVSASVARDIVPQIKDMRWFFDTELVIRAERAGHRIEEVAVTWHELQPAGRKSRVRIVPLIREYVSRVVALRRELGPRKKGEEKSILSGIVRSITRQEWQIVLGAASVVAVLGLIPPLLGVWSASRYGVEWNGRQYLAPGDFAVYLSYIAQAKGGHLLFDNFASTEHLTPVLNILWLKTGWLAWMLGLSPLAAFHLVRTLYIFPLAAVVYCSLAYVFQRRAERVTGYLLFMFSSGVGLYAMPFLQASKVARANYQWPIDYWVAEANAFMTMIYSPHFIASLLLIIATAILLLVALDKESPAHGAFAGLAALVLFQFHPFHAPTLYVVAILALLLRTLTYGFRYRQWLAIGLFYLLSAPSVAYHYWLTHWSPNAVFMLENNITTTPSPIYLLIGFGVIVPLAAFGWIQSHDEKIISRGHRQFFAAWFFAQFILLYSPFVFQRRLIEGIQFPLVVLAIPAIFGIMQARVFKRIAGIVVLAIIVPALFLPTTFSTVGRSIEAANPKNDRDGFFFFPQDKSATLEWIRNQTLPDAVILSTMGMGNDVIGWGERRAYVGHWANTIDSSRKLAELVQFYGYMTNEQRSAFAHLHGITHVIVGPAERSIGDAPLTEPAFSLRFVSGDYAVYAVND